MRLLTNTDLPSAVALAHRIRYDGYTADELALEHATIRQRIVEHLAAGGYDATGYKAQRPGQVNGKRRRLKDSDTGQPVNHVNGADRPISTQPAQYRPSGRRRSAGLDWGANRPPDRPLVTRCRWCREPTEAEDLVDEMCPNCRADAVAKFIQPSTPTVAAASDAPSPASEPKATPSPGPRYTLEEHAQQIIARYRAGESPQEIAPDYGVTGKGIAALLRRHQVPMRSRAEAQRLARAKRTESVQQGTQTVQSEGDAPEQIQARREELLADLARPRRSSERHDEPLRGPPDDNQMSDSGENPSEIELTPDVDPHTPRVDDTDSEAEAADAPQMPPVDTNEGSNDGHNATESDPEPVPRSRSKQVHKSLASNFETSKDEPASAASRAKSTGHSHGNGGTCHSLHARQFDATAALLLRGRESGRKRTQALAVRINDLLIDLRDRLDEEDKLRRDKAEQARKREEEKAEREAAKAEARAEVERLQRELADAKARARGHNKGYSRPITKAIAPGAIPASHPTNAGRSAGGKAQSKKASYDAREVRAWCKANDVDCPARGRFLPKHVLEAFYAANPERRTE